MDELRDRLAFLTDWLPAELRDSAPVEVWWLASLVVVLAALLVVGTVLRRLLSALFAGRPVTTDWEPDLREDLVTLPLPNSPPVVRVYHVPARLRLIVVASASKGIALDPYSIDALLDRAVPGLGQLVLHDRPRIVLWPAPISELGFASSFHRATPTGDRANQPSRWVFLAGRARGGGVAVFIGLALWTDQPTTLGRKNLSVGDWLELLRLERHP